VCFGIPNSQELPCKVAFRGRSIRESGGAHTTRRVVEEEEGVDQFFGLFFFSEPAKRKEIPHIQLENG